jgi:hypothetical protein
MEMDDASAARSDRADVERRVEVLVLTVPGAGTFDRLPAPDYANIKGRSAHVSSQNIKAAPLYVE